MCGATYGDSSWGLQDLALSQADSLPCPTRFLFADLSPAILLLADLQAGALRMSFFALVCESLDTEERSHHQLDDTLKRISQFFPESVSRLCKVGGRVEL